MTRVPGQRSVVQPLPGHGGQRFLVVDDAPSAVEGLVGVRTLQTALVDSVWDGLVVEGVVLLGGRQEATVRAVLTHRKYLLPDKNQIFQNRCLQMLFFPTINIEILMKNSRPWFKYGKNYPLCMKIRIKQYKEYIDLVSCVLHGTCLKSELSFHNDEVKAESYDDWSN